MIEYRQDSSTGILEILIDGDISQADVQGVTAMLERVRESGRRLRVLEVVKTIGSMEPNVFMDEFEFALRHLDDSGRAALVIDRPWMESLGVLVRPFVGNKVRTFDLEDIDEARRWLKMDPDSITPAD